MQLSVPRFDRQMGRICASFQIIYNHWNNPLRLASTLKVNSSAQLASVLLISLNILVQLLGDISKLRSSVLALSSLNLSNHNLELQLQNLVLDLAVLESPAGSGLLTARRLDGLVEATGLGLGVFGRLASSLEDGEILGVDGAGIIQIDLINS